MISASPLMVLRVEHFVFDAAAIEHRAEAFALLNAHRADEDRPAFAANRVDLRAGDRLLVLRFLRLEDDVGAFFAKDGAELAFRPPSDRSGPTCASDSISSQIASNFSRSVR